VREVRLVLGKADGDGGSTPPLIDDAVPESGVLKKGVAGVTAGGTSEVRSS
jgi:hypothetical protein